MMGWGIALQRVCAALVLVTTALWLPAADAQTPVSKPAGVQLLFVQSARTAEISKDGMRLTLKGLAPTTLYFSDRPARIAGHYRTDEYLQFWKGGQDSFLKDPPNATLSAFEPGQDDLIDVVVTLRNARVSGDQISYDIKVISGQLPPRPVGPVSLFIDIIGLPFTPLSFAGVARRTAYRSVMWGAAATSAASAAAATAAAHPTTITVVQSPAPPPAAPASAPAVTGSQAAAVQKLKELKSLLNQGLITQAQYSADSQKLLNEIVQ